MTTTSTLRTKVSRSTLQKENLLQAQTEKVEMTLNTDNAIASGLLIQRLTELYEDPIEASVRETVSNGIDAVMQAFSGETPVIEISSPTTLNPVFIVRDNGVGMSYHDLKEIYSKYGASTKMNNFDQIGAYGLGAKAPLAYGTQFTVSSVKDGEKTTIIVVREELTNYIKIVESGPTEEQSGTTVSIPVSSQDIQRFNTHISKYKENPSDKDGVKFIIDDKEVVQEEYAVITDQMVIFKDANEEITSRLWIKKDEQTIVNLIAAMSETDVRRSLQYLIGGWSYSSPARRNNSYYRSNAAGIVVELKAGIVGFNSARDAILENERYQNLEDLVVNYIKSNEFINDITKMVNTLELEKFKSVIVSLMRRNENDLYIKNGEIKVKNQAGSYHSSTSRMVRNYSMSQFVHEETGFRFDHILKDVPKGNDKNTVAILEAKESYRKTADNSIFSSKTNDEGEVRYTKFYGDNAKEITLRVDEIMNGLEDSHSLESLMLYLTLNGYVKNNNNIRMTFITDVTINDADPKQCNFAKLSSGRKTLTRLRNEGKSEASYSSYVVYTQHTKAEIKKMLETAKFNDLDVEVETAEDWVTKVNEYRKQNRTAPTKRATADLTITVMKYDDEDKNMKSSKLEDIEVEDGKKIVFIVTKERHQVYNKEVQMMKSWYCNENDLTSDEVELYVTAGNHRVVEINLLKELGELYENPRSRYAGTSNLYKELIESNVAKLHPVNKKDKDVEKKSFIRLLSHIHTQKASGVFSEYVSVLREAKLVAEIAGYELTEIPTAVMNELGEFGDETFGQEYSGRHWALADSAVIQLVENISKDKFKVIENLSPLNSNHIVKLHEDGRTTRQYTGRNIVSFDIEQTKLAYDAENKEDSFFKMIRSQIEATLDYVNETIKGVSTLNFG